MPLRDFLGIHAREMELTAELYAFEAQHRYALADDERRNFYTVYSTASHEQHQRFHGMSSRHFEKARRAEANSHTVINELRNLRGQFIQQLSLGSRLGRSMEAVPGAILHMHAPILRSTSTQSQAYNQEIESLLTALHKQPPEPQGLHGDNRASREHMLATAPTQDQRDEAAQYWYTRALGLGVEEQSALLSMQQYLSGERDEEVADLLRQQAVEQGQHTADDQGRYEEDEYGLLAGDLLQQRVGQRRAPETAIRVGKIRASYGRHEGDSQKVRILAAEVERLRRRVATLNSMDRAAAGEVSVFEDQSSTESSETRDCRPTQPFYGPAEGEAGPSNWLYAEPEEYDGDDEW